MTLTVTTVAQRLAAFAVTPAATDVADSIVDDSRRRLRDVVGLALAAADTDVAESARQLAAAWGGRGEATLIGSTARSGRAGAAFHNGTLAHALDFDDTHLPSVLHPSASVVPAAIAAAESEGAAPADLLHAIAVGNEICIRLGLGGYDPEARNSIFFDRGQHATAICGTLGAAVAAGLLLGLDEAGVADAIAVAASMGSGIIEANRTGGSVKRVHCGWAAHAGLAAAELVRFGITGPPTALEGRFGFFTAWCGDRARIDAVTAALGEHWHVLDVAFKPYPANHFTHALVDAALELRARGVTPESLAHARIGVPTAVLRTISEPWEAKIRPPTGYAARFSGPFVFAVALSGGGGLGVYLDDFTDAVVEDPTLLACAARTSFGPSTVCDELFPESLPAIVEAVTHDGERHEVEVLENRGTCARPLSDEELSLKFRLNAERHLGHERARLLDEAIEAPLDDAWLPRILALTH